MNPITIIFVFTITITTIFPWISPWNHHTLWKNSSAKRRGFSLQHIMEARLPGAFDVGWLDGLLGVAGGCWDYDITIVMKWIIPENSLSNTSKLQMGNQVARKCFEVGLNLWLVSDQGQAALNQCYSNDCKQPYRERLQTTLGTDPQTPGWFRIGFAYNFWRIHLGSRWHFRMLYIYIYITNIFEQPGLSPKRW